MIVEIGDVQGAAGRRLAGDPGRRAHHSPALAGQSRAQAQALRAKHRRQDIGRRLYRPSREAAEKAHDATWRANVEKRTGAAPTIVYFDLMMLLDNEAGTVTEWSETGEKQVVATP